MSLQTAILKPCSVGKHRSKLPRRWVVATCAMPGAETSRESRGHFQPQSQYRGLGAREWRRSMANWELRFREEQSQHFRADSELVQIDYKLTEAEARTVELEQALEQATKDNTELQDTMCEAARQLNDLEGDAKAGWSRAQELEQLIEQKQRELAEAQLAVTTKASQLEAALVSRNEWRAAAGGLESYSNLLRDQLEAVRAGVRVATAEATDSVKQLGDITRDELKELEARWQRTEDQRFAAVEHAEVAERYIAKVEDELTANRKELESEHAARLARELEAKWALGELAASVRRMSDWQENCLDARARVLELESTLREVTDIAETMRQMACQDPGSLFETLSASHGYMSQLQTTVRRQQVEMAMRDATIKEKSDRLVALEVERHNASISTKELKLKYFDCCKQLEQRDRRIETLICKGREAAEALCGRGESAGREAIEWVDEAENSSFCGFAADLEVAPGEWASDLLREQLNSLGLAVETRERELAWADARITGLKNAFERGMRIQQTKIDHLEADLGRAEEVAIDTGNHLRTALDAGRDALEALSSLDEPTLAMQLKQAEEHLLGGFGDQIGATDAGQWASSRVFELERQVLDMTMGDAGFERIAASDIIGSDACQALHEDHLDGGHYTCTEPRGHMGPHRGKNLAEGGTCQWPNDTDKSEQLGTASIWDGCDVEIAPEDIAQCMADECKPQVDDEREIQCGAPSPQLPGRTCTLPGGHDGWHEHNQIHIAGETWESWPREHLRADTIPTPPPEPSHHTACEGCGDSIDALNLLCPVCRAVQWRKAGHMPPEPSHVGQQFCPDCGDRLEGNEWGVAIDKDGQEKCGRCIAVSVTKKRNAEMRAELEPNYCLDEHTLPDGNVVVCARGHHDTRSPHRDITGAYSWVSDLEPQDEVTSTHEEMPPSQGSELLAKLWPMLAGGIAFAASQELKKRFGSDRPDFTEDSPAGRSEGRPDTCSCEQSEALRQPRGIRRAHRARRTRESCRVSTPEMLGAEGRTCAKDFRTEPNKPVTERHFSEPCQKMANGVDGQRSEQSSSTFLVNFIGAVAEALGLTKPSK